MKKIVIIISFLAFAIIGCKKNNQPKKIISGTNKTFKPELDLKQDYVDFKSKMTELDTIKVFINHSVCTFQGYERLRITKESDSIRIRSEFKDYDEQNPKWKLVFEKKISEKDTIWDFGNFLKRNKKRLKTDSVMLAKIEINYKQQWMKFKTKGLVELNRFKADYDSTMRKLHRPTKNLIYGEEILTENETIIGE